MSEIRENNSPSIRIIDEDRNCYKDYHFIEDSNDIQNKILSHILFFGQNTKFHDHKDILKAFTSLCHKINMVKYHLIRYQKVENMLEQELLKSERFIDHDGVVLVERIELTAEYESFLVQVKSSLDILVKFLNIIYRNGQKNPMKFQSTFSDKGKGVIKSIEKYLRQNSQDKDKLLELLRYLKNECAVMPEEGSDEIHWLTSIINKRDTIAHFQKPEYFAFQIVYLGGKNTITRPQFTKTMSMFESLQIVYDNLLVFVQDFIALLFIPYLDGGLEAYTYKREDVICDAPHWYLQLSKAFPPYLVWQNMGNLSIIKSLCKDNKGRLTPDYVEKMYLHYASFYKQQGVVITSSGVEEHEANRSPKLLLQFAD